eukprot:jgi/Mesvir1/21180/Mv25038-RA.3
MSEDTEHVVGVRYFSNDFSWESLAEAGAAAVARQQAERSNVCDFSRLPSTSWDRFHKTHASAKFFKERRYLLAAFPELSPVPGGTTSTLDATRSTVPPPSLTADQYATPSPQDNAGVARADANADNAYESAHGHGADSDVSIPNTKVTVAHAFASITNTASTEANVPNSVWDSTVDANPHASSTTSSQPAITAASISTSISNSTTSIRTSTSISASISRSIPKPPPTVLEVGCGSGSSLVAILRGHPAAVVYGCDLSATAVEHARQAVAALGPACARRCHLFVWDPCCSPFPSSALATSPVASGTEPPAVSGVTSPAAVVRSHQCCDGDEGDGCLSTGRDGRNGLGCGMPMASDGVSAGVAGGHDGSVSAVMQDGSHMSIRGGHYRSGGGQGGASCHEGRHGDGQGADCGSEDGDGWGQRPRGCQVAHAEDAMPAVFDAVMLIFTLSAVHPDDMPSFLASVTRVLKPGGKILFRDYGLYDMSMLRFAGRHLAGDSLYVRGDGTLSYFFSREMLQGLMEAMGLEMNEYCCVASVNRRKGSDMKRVWLQAKFRLPVPSTAGMLSCQPY